MRSNIKYVLISIALILFTAGMNDGNLFSTFTVRSVGATELTAEDFASFLDSVLDNVTASVAQPYSLYDLSGKLVQNGTEFHLGKVTVRSSTFNYNIREWIDEDEGLILHNANPKFLDLYYQAGYYMQNYDLNLMLKSTEYGDIHPKIMSLCKSLGVENDTSESVGDRVAIDGTYACNDISGDTFDIETDANTDYLWDEGQELLPQYQVAETAFDTKDDGRDQINTETEQKLILCGFDDTEEAVMTILKANIAANLTVETGNTYVADDIDIVSYALVNSTGSTYISEEVMNQAYESIDSYLEDEGVLETMYSLWGINFKLSKTVKTKDFIRGKESFFGFDLGKALNDVVGGAAKVVSNLPVVKTTLNVLDAKTGNPIDDLIKGVDKTIKDYQGMGKAIMSEADKIIKTVTTPKTTTSTVSKTQVKTFGTKTKQDVKPIVSPQYKPEAEPVINPPVSAYEGTPQLTSDSYAQTVSVPPTPEKTTTIAGIPWYFFVIGGIVILALLGALALFLLSKRNSSDPSVGKNTGIVE